MKYGFYLSGLNNSGVSVVTCRLANYLGKKHSVDIIVDGPVDVDDQFFKFHKNVNFILDENKACDKEVNSPNIKNKRLSFLLKKSIKPILGRFCWEVTRAISNKYHNYDVSCYDTFFVCCLSGKFRFALNNKNNIFYVIHNQKSIQLKSGAILGDWFDKKFFRLACNKKKIVAVSQSVKTDLVSFLKINKEQVKVIYNSLVVDGQLTAPEKVEDNIIVIGRLSDQKRFDRAISAFCNFKEVTNRDTKLLVIGKGELEIALKTQAGETKFSRDIKFLGHRKDILNVIANSSLVMISSDYEGFSTVAVESILLRTQVVASPSESLKEINMICPGGVKLAKDMSVESLADTLISTYKSGFVLSDDVCEILESIVSPDNCTRKYEEMGRNGHC